MGYNIEVLVTAEQCRLVMQRAKGRDPDLYQRAFNQQLKLEEQKYEDPLEGEFWASVIAYEQLLSEKNGKTTRATRVRQKIQRLGGGIDAVTQTLEAWAIDKGVKVGFDNLLKAGTPHRMAEYIVAYRFPERFSKNAVANATAKLARHGIVFSSSSAETV